MSLPWFPFHIDKFLSDTLALDGTAVGAYHLLMLHYYATGTPPRDNDRVLATIARLPMDVWLERRPEIEAFFQIHDGTWHHATIEAEIAEANAKHASGIARAKAGAAAMHAKMGHNPASRTAQAMPEAISKQARRAFDALSDASRLPEAVPKQCLTVAPLTLTKESLSVCSDVTVEKDNSGDNSVEQQGLAREESIGTPIDPQFRLHENHLAACKFDGADEATINAEVAGFIATHRERGTFSHDWDASWTMWWKRWRDHQAAKKPKPRIEVSNSPPDWAAHAKRWAEGMGWPRGVGGEPGSARCRCPSDVLLAHDIDPTTGLKHAPEKV